MCQARLVWPGREVRPRTELEAGGRVRPGAWGRGGRQAHPRGTGPERLEPVANKSIRISSSCGLHSLVSVYKKGLPVWLWGGPSCPVQAPLGAFL